MFRLLMLKNNLALHRNLITRLTARSNVLASGLVCRSAHRSRLIDGVVVVDINLDDVVKGDVDFARSFTKSLVQAAGEPLGKTGTQLPSLENVVPAKSPQPAGTSSTVLDRDGKPIVHIEIDGWNQDVEDEEKDENNQDASIEGNASVDKE
ncbi:hypothetical protein KR032_010421 [Drosophila birchii]|nr:hypothetical protein KR032_010421 [Drosophila birchii]